ncbi:hypothetical protein PALB_11430 [Pseudoalteromonas luteoviolacea B = ATCC 29581]|nr:hypothetical protein PALB_11430 [Pseudoalteromonas luteoviolacea B = ATCC 29581]
MKILVLGSSNTFYIRSYLDYFYNISGVEIAFINTNLDCYFVSDGYKIYNYCSNDSYKTGKVGRVKSFVKTCAKFFRVDDSKFQRVFMEYLNNKSKLNKIDDIDCFINAFKPDLAFLFWGTTLRFEARFLKERTIPTVLSVNTYPITFDSEYKPTKRDREYFSSFSGLIFSSHRMKEFFISNGLLNKEQRFIVNPDFIETEQKFESTIVEKNTAIKKVIFLGNVDFQHRQADDVRGEILALAGRGVEVWIQSTRANNSVDGHENLKGFAPFNYEQIRRGELNRFIKDNFNAVLYCYNSSGSLREELSITTRFSLSESAGVPVLMKKNKFLAIEEEFKNKTAFILYDDINELDLNVSIPLTVNSNMRERKMLLENFVKSFR